VRRCVPVAAALLLAAVAAFAADDGTLPGREIMLPREEVFDTFLAYLLGVIERDVAARLPRDHLLDVLVEVRDSPGLARIAEVAWLRGEAPGSRRLSFTFDGELHYPMPLDIFGYHPGSIDASRTIVLREERRGRGPPGSRFHWLVVEEGGATVDFDAWLDVLAGPLLDDFTLAGVALFIRRGRWTAVLVGRGDRGQAVPWAFGLERTRILFPTPPDLAALAARLLAGE
jgi:hypothetical protein